MLWKKTDVSPVFKEDRHHPASDGPINLTSIFSKVLQRILKRFILLHLLHNNLLSANIRLLPRFTNKLRPVGSLLQA